MLPLVGLAVTGVSLYLLLPSLLATFTSWRSLLDLEPLWYAAAFGCEIACFISIWALQRVALREPSWFVVATSQLSGNAAGRIVPGGMATTGALQYSMLSRAGVPRARIATALTATSALLFGTMLAMPVLAVPTLLAGTPVDRGLEQSVWLGTVAFALLLGVAVAAFAFDQPLALVGRFVKWALGKIGRQSPTATPEGLLYQRDEIRAALGSRWKLALMSSVGRSLFDYLALVGSLWATGARVSPSLILLAYVAATLLGMVPLTPGGLGFVEAGLTGLLVLAGVAGDDAVLATLAYRLLSFWLPIPVGGIAYVVFRHRFRGPIEPTAAAA